MTNLVKRRRDRRVFEVLKTDVPRHMVLIRPRGRTTGQRWVEGEKIFREFDRQ